MKVVHYPEPPDDALFRQLRELTPGWQIERGPPDPNTTVLISGRVTREDLAQASNLRAVIIPFAGVPVRVRDLMVEFPAIAVHNLHHNAPETAEMAVALMLACAKRIVPSDQALRRGDWSPRYDDANSIRLEGRTVGIIGFGAIGQRVARACIGLGMRVVAHRRTATKDQDGVIVRGPESLHETLRESDVVVLALPHTPDTTNLLGAPEFAAMKPGAILVNIARARLVDEAALYEALRSGHLGAAGLDVWYRYPEGESQAGLTQPSEYPFHELNNVVMSPHRGGSSVDVELARIHALAELLNTEPMPNLVNLQLGY